MSPPCLSNLVDEVGRLTSRVRHSDLRPRPLDHQSLYEALCKGLPAVYLKSSVTGTPLADLEAPYAYPIAGNSESLEEALRSALKNPIKSYLGESRSGVRNVCPLLIRFHRYYSTERFSGFQRCST